MPNLTQLRIAAREIFAETLRSVDASAAVRRAVHLEGSRLAICETTIDIENRNVYSISIGKAAFAMASALDEILDSRLAAGVIASNVPVYGAARSGDRISTRRDAGEPQAGMPALLSRWRIFRGGHPEPNEQSLAAARACFDLLEGANAERALVVLLISGGGSAMLEWPISNDITLSDLRLTNRALVTSGVSITEVNAVRRAFSAVKGGRLAARAPHCEQITLIVSDVPPAEEANVASGPTLPPPKNAAGPQEVIRTYDLRSQLPNAVLRAIDIHANDSRADPEARQMRRHFVLLDNQSALEAAAKAARQSGFACEVARDIVDQPIEEGSHQLFLRLHLLCEQARGNRSPKGSTPAACLISGGEFACPVRGNGIGGRNQETALRLVIEYNNHRNRREQESNFVALCAGTDGIDGNSPAAGAIVDSTTLDRAEAIGLDPRDFLDRSDAYSFFIAIGDTITTGPTGTNVRDLRIMLATA